VTSRLYDPLGWISPILVEMKLLFQKLCRSKEDWDEELSPDMKEHYDKWMSELRKVGGIRIPRCYFRENDHMPVSVELPRFSDASSYAYAAVVYLGLNWKAV